MPNPNPPRDVGRRDVGKEIDRAIPDPNVARRAAKDIEEHTQHPLHDQVFGSDPDGYVNDTPPGAIGENVNIIGTAVQPEGFQPMRNVGDTDQGDRQPLGGRRR